VVEGEEGNFRGADGLGAGVADGVGCCVRQQSNWEEGERWRC
jgi:hypothetical protein